VPHREIERIAKAIVMESRDESLTKAKASSVVQDELRRLRAKEERKRLRQLERNSRVMSKEERPVTQGLLVNETHAQNGAV